MSTSGQSADALEKAPNSAVRIAGTEPWKGKDMKAIQIEKFGGPEVLKTAKIPTPEAGEDELLIELRASGANRSDILARSGSYHAAGQPPIVPGFEGSGVVREPGRQQRA